MTRLDPHHRLLIAVVNIGGDDKFASDAGRLLDHRPRQCAINLDLHRSLSLMGFTFYDHNMALGQKPEFYQELHRRLHYGLHLARVNMRLFLSMAYRPAGQLPFVARITPNERVMYATIILDQKLLPLWEEEESSNS